MEEFIEESRFEDFVGLITKISKEVQRIKTVEAAKLGLKGSDVMCLYYLSQHEEGLTGAELAREVDVTRAAISRTLARLEDEGYVEACAEDDDATRYRVPMRLTAKGQTSMVQASEVIRRVVTEAGNELGDSQRRQMYRSLCLIYDRLCTISR